VTEPPVRHHANVAARAAVAVVAVLLLAWLAVLLRDFYVADAATDRIFYDAGITPAEFVRNMERLEDAELLNPDSTWELTRAKFLLLRDGPRRAAHAAEALVRNEPANVEAWVVLRKATRQIDPARSAEAAGQIKRLDPLAGRDERRRR
jgi:hypothetical protein